MSQSEGGQAGKVPFYCQESLIGWGPPRLERTIFFTQSTSISAKNVPTVRLRIISDQISGHPVAQSTLKINCDTK